MVIGKETERTDKEITSMKTCAICLEEIGSSMTITQCIHHFHTNCLQRWQNSRSSSNNQCPICRTELDETSSKSSSGSRSRSRSRSSSDEEIVPMSSDSDDNRQRVRQRVNQYAVHRITPIGVPISMPINILEDQSVNIPRSIPRSAIMSPPSRILAHYSYCSICDESTMAYEVCHNDELCEIRANATCRKNHPMVHRVVPYGTDPPQRCRECNIM